MKIQSVQLHRFRRFAHLTISELPEAARLVVLAGPNGYGKSSLFDAFQLWAGQHGGRGWQDDRDYYDATERVKEPEVAQLRSIQLTFHGEQPTSRSNEARKAFYLRTAHRNDPELQITNISRVAHHSTRAAFTA